MGLDLNYQPDVVVEDIGLLTEEEWLEYRRKGIGGSDAGVLYGLSKYKTEKDLWLDKTGRLPPEKDSISSWLAKEYGHYLEELVAITFAKVTGYRVFKVPKMFRHPLYPYMQALTAMRQIPISSFLRPVWQESPVSPGLTLLRQT